VPQNNYTGGLLDAGVDCITQAALDGSIYSLGSDLFNLADPGGGYNHISVASQYQHQSSPGQTPGDWFDAIARDFELAEAGSPALLPAVGQAPTTTAAFPLGNPCDVSDLGTELNADSSEIELDGSLPLSKLGSHKCMATPHNDLVGMHVSAPYTPPPSDDEDLLAGSMNTGIEFKTFWLEPGAKWTPMCTTTISSLASVV